MILLATTNEPYLPVDRLLKLPETEVYLPSPAQWEVLKTAQRHAGLQGAGAITTAMIRRVMDANEK